MARRKLASGGVSLACAVLRHGRGESDRGATDRGTGAPVVREPDVHAPGLRVSAGWSTSGAGRRVKTVAL